MKQIIAIGGGGFGRSIAARPYDPLLEKYFTQQANVKNPRICFIPTASGEAQNYIVNFYRTFNALDCKPSHLSLFDPPISDLRSYLLAQDAIYVGGGNTKSMLALWREWKVDQILKEAWEKGIVLGGVSAGALCWFEEGVTDSIPGPLTGLKCMGFLKGSHCPHYDGEKERRPSYHRLMEEGLKPGLAADDFVALHYVDREFKQALCANDCGKAYRVELKEGSIAESVIEPLRL